MKKNNWLIFIFVGTISAFIALLFAPKAGDEMREDIKNKAKDTRDSVKEGTENLVDDFKKSYFEAVDEVEEELTHLDDRQKQLNQTISSIEKDLLH